MKYTPKELKGNVNVGNTAYLKNFFILSVSSFLIAIFIYTALGLILDILVTRLPDKVEKNLEKIFPVGYLVGEYQAPTPAIKNMVYKLTEELGELSKKDYNIYIVEDEAVNAFVVPPANIVLFSGLLNEIESENELSFILAHELGHFVNKDHLKGLGRNLILLTASLLVLGEDNSYTRLIIDSLMKVEMRFSQKQEIAADLLALELLNNAYGHVGGAVDFFKRHAKDETAIMFLFASHPYSGDRVEILNNEIKEHGYQVKAKKKFER